jgi:hypothetical protein
MTRKQLEMDYVQKEAKANPEVAEIFNQLETLYKKKYVVVLIIHSLSSSK